MLIASRHQTKNQQNNEIIVCLNEVSIEQVKYVKYFGITIDENLTLNEH